MSQDDLSTIYIKPAVEKEGVAPDVLHNIENQHRGVKSVTHDKEGHAVIGLNDGSQITVTSMRLDFDSEKNGRSIVSF